MAIYHFLGEFSTFGYDYELIMTSSCRLHIHIEYTQKYLKQKLELYGKVPSFLSRVIQDKNGFHVDFGNHKRIKGGLMR